MDKPNIARNGRKRKHEILGTPIRVSGRIVGQVIPPNYVKDITNRHMLTTPPAIANDIQALTDAERAGAIYCVFTNINTGIVYTASIAEIFERGRHVNFGYGDQYALGLGHWTQSQAPGYATPTEEPEVKPLKYKSRVTKGAVFNGVQLPLFGGRR
ncbi:MAG: hypothetical protein HY864_09745 [Chloroflexi bacterium]|nr:hypothetical protein [Chloroflexota bacterium]